MHRNLGLWQEATENVGAHRCIGVTHSLVVDMSRMVHANSPEPKIPAKVDKFRSLYFDLDIQGKTVDILVKAFRKEIMETLKDGEVDLDTVTIIRVDASSSDLDLNYQVPLSSEDVRKHNKDLEEYHLKKQWFPQILAEYEKLKEGSTVEHNERIRQQIKDLEKQLR